MVVRVSGNPTGACSARDPNLNPTHVELGFVFHPWVHPKLENNPKPERNPKKLKKNPKETRKNPKETHLQNPTGTRTQPKT
jgi:hypothetical protein